MVNDPGSTGFDFPPGDSQGRCIPAVAVPKWIAGTLRELLSRKGLYQNVSVPLDWLGIHYQDVTERESKIAEFRTRPWIPVSDGLGNRLGYGQRPISLALPQSPARPIPIDRTELHFSLPVIETWCPHCKRETVYQSTSDSTHDTTGPELPLFSEDTLQLYTLYYNCAICRRQLLVFMVKRRGPKLQLCGRSERLVFSPDNVVPEKFRPIVSDAISATNEGDVPAGFYHLRTFLEHYMKDALNYPIETRLVGDTLAREYAEGQDRVLNERYPSLATLYEEASTHMHARTGTPEEFQSLLTRVVDHLSGRRSLESHPPPTAPSS